LNLRKATQAATCLLFVSLLAPLCGFAEDRRYFPVTPRLNDGQKWRIGYCEGGPYLDYRKNLVETVRALMAHGWIEKEDLPSSLDDSDTRRLWGWLANDVRSRFLSFVEDAYWSSDWDEAVLRVRNKAEMLKRLKTGNDLDLMIAMGTWAGQDLANSYHQVAVVVAAAANPIQAGIIKSVEDSGHAHVLASVDPARYLRQLRLFHDIIGFKRLGVVYDGSDSGRVYANLLDVQQVALERGFTIVECQARDQGNDEAEAAEALYACWQELAPRIDALWITVHRGENPRFMPESLTPLFEHRVATWTRRGSDQVRRGVLMSISRKDLRGLGNYYASVIAKVFNGARPGDLDQVYKEPLKIAINLATAERIGYTPPRAILAVADEVFREIQSGPMTP
jgi:ABC-type uncharacterized transport system substrate-binding protein